MWLDKCDSEDLKPKDFVIKALLYANNIILLTCDDFSLQKHLDNCAKSCTQNQLELNIKKSKVMIMVTRSKFFFCHQDLPLE